MKRGSALLIVLGMISFLVISAVAFSAYMRYNRLPSSYLRRTSFSRQLAKAALAEAIDRLDVALGNDPFTFDLEAGDYTEGGVYNDNDGYDYPRRDDPSTQIRARRERRNYWRHHCFIGTNRLALANDTISTLTLEGLAYLPPALINEARYYSRHADSAKWRNFNFDAGRYAFFAVDVSDHIDVNRVFADIGRNSSDRGRITIAHVFENGTHDGAGSPSAADWDGFMDQFLSVDDIKDGVGNAYSGSASSKLPLISLADLNLALNRKGWAQQMSPFCRYLNTDAGSDFVTDTGTGSEMIRQMSFVTDSYFPNTNTANSAQYDLCYSQPFRNMYHDKTRQMSYAEQMGGGMSTPILTKLYDTVTELDTVSLYDYLDENDIPTSLALPSVERVPMICGLMPNVTFKLKASQTIANPPPTSGLNESSPPLTGPTAVRHINVLQMQGEDATVDVMTMYPFRRGEEADGSTSFDVEVALRIGFTIGNGPGLRGAAGSGFGIADEAEFKKDGVVENGLIKLYHKCSGKPKSTGVTDENSAFSTLGNGESFSGFAQIRNYLEAHPVFTVPHRYEVVNMGSENNPNWQYEDRGPDTVAQPTIDANFHPLNADGTGNGGFTPQSLNSVEVIPYVTVTARVLSQQSHKTVDLVPATILDDQGFNGLDTDPEVGAVGGGGRAFFTLGGTKIVFGEDEFKTGQEVDENFTPKTSGGMWLCPDPRWNFAPENFFVKSGTSFPSAQTFVDNLDLEKDGRDCDIFMFCGNQGYLQSPSEFAFLPRTTTAQLPLGGSQFGSCAATYNRTTLAECDGVVDYSVDKLAHGALMWKTYHAFDHGGIRDRLYDLGINATGTGYRANPFTPSADVMMAALANTPYDWWAASTNFTANAGKTALDGLGAEDFNAKYAFNQMSGSKAKFAWNDLKKVADRLVRELRSYKRNGKRTWQEAFDEMNWDYENGLLGVDFSGQSDELMDVDRKMLHGFWRDSMAARQQLFLVFVRAEPPMMGGGAVNQAPPQLGARAVALVWRDPTPTQENVGDNQPQPHRTRVLFYRQLD